MKEKNRLHLLDEQQEQINSHFNSDDTRLIEEFVQWQRRKDELRQKKKKKKKRIT